MSVATMEAILVGLWIIAALVVTVFPLAYACSRWFQTPEGRAIMLRSVAMMLLVDETVILYFWSPGVTGLFWIQALTLVFTIVAAAYLAFVVIRAQIMGVRLVTPVSPAPSGHDKAPQP